MFSGLGKLKAHHQSLFAIILAVALIMLHRGIVGLADRFLFPANPVLSHVASICIAIAILVSTHYCVRGMS